MSFLSEKLKHWHFRFSCSVKINNIILCPTSSVTDPIYLLDVEQWPGTVSHCWDDSSPPSGGRWEKCSVLCCCSLAQFSWKGALRAAPVCSILFLTMLRAGAAPAVQGLSWARPFPPCPVQPQLWLSLPTVPVPGAGSSATPHIHISKKSLWTLTSLSALLLPRASII